MLGVVIQTLLIRPARGRPLLPVIMITIALAIVLRALIEIMFGVQARTLTTRCRREASSSAACVSQLHLTAAIVSWACMAGFGAFFKFTSAGLLMRATANSHEAALVSGINVNRVNAGAWAIGTVLAAIGGVFLGQLQVASPELENIGCSRCRPWSSADCKAFLARSSACWSA